MKDLLSEIAVLSQWQ